MTLENRKLAVVIPAYRVANIINQVVTQIPSYVDWIIIVLASMVHNKHIYFQCQMLSFLSYPEGLIESAY